MKLLLVWNYCKVKTVKLLLVRHVQSLQRNACIWNWVLGPYSPHRLCNTSYPCLFNNKIKKGYLVWTQLQLSQNQINLSLSSSFSLQGLYMSQYIFVMHHIILLYFIDAVHRILALCIQCTILGFTEGGQKVCTWRIVLPVLGCSKHF